MSLIDYLIESKEAHAEEHFLPLDNHKIIVLKLLISFTFTFKILDFI